MRTSKIIFISLILLWVFLPLSLPYNIMLLGFIAVYLALHNLLALRLAEQRDVQSNKKEFMINKFGATWGVKMYNILFILAPFFTGVYVMGSGLVLLFSGS